MSQIEKQAKHEKQVKQDANSAKRKASAKQVKVKSNVRGGPSGSL